MQPFLFNAFAKLRSPMPPPRADVYCCQLCNLAKGTSGQGIRRRAGKGVFQVKVSQRLYPSITRSRSAQRFALPFFCNLLLPSFAASQ